MKRSCTTAIAAVLFILVFLATGCGIGTKRMLFATNTSVGVDIDTTPPTTSIAYSRTEGVIAPQFPNAGVHDVLATSHNNAKPGLKTLSLGFMNSQTFLTGHAAWLFAKGTLEGGNVTEIQKPVSNPGGTVAVGEAVLDEPDWTLGLVPGLIWDGLIKGILVGEIEKRNERIPYFFATNTSFGLAVKYTPKGDPRALNLGFKRQEIALVPVSESADQKTFSIPSLVGLFSLNAKVQPDGEKSGVDTNISQVFATGLSAEMLARSKSIRESFLLPSLVGSQAAGEYLKGGAEAKKAREAEATTRKCEEIVGAEIARLYGTLDAAKKDTVRKTAQLNGILDPDPAMDDSAFISRIRLGAATPGAAERCDKRQALLDAMQTGDLFK